MNKVIYDQAQGFPLDVNILDFGQKANQISQQLGEIIAPLAIVSGCVENWNNISDGVVYIDGELLPFKGGLKQNNVRIVEEEGEQFERIFESGERKKVLVSRYATFGMGATKSYNWNDFYRSMGIKELERKLHDKTDINGLSERINGLLERINKLEIFARPFSQGGGMVFFNRPMNEIPEGWREVVDWRGRIPMHLDPNDYNLNSVGKTYGDKERVLTTANLPRNRYGNLTGDAIQSDGKPRYLSGYQKGDDNYLGNNQPFSILPPVKIAVFIEPII